jgi:hypothetical protein
MASEGVEVLKSSSHGCWGMHPIVIPADVSPPNRPLRYITAASTLSSNAKIGNDFVWTTIISTYQSECLCVYHPEFVIHSQSLKGTATGMASKVSMKTSTWHVSVTIYIFLVHLTMLTIAQIIQSWTFGWLVNNRLRSKWRKVVVTLFEMLCQHLPGAKPKEPQSW